MGSRSQCNLLAEMQGHVFLFLCLFICLAGTQISKANQFCIGSSCNNNEIARARREEDKDEDIDLDEEEYKDEDIDLDEEEDKDEDLSEEEEGEEDDNLEEEDEEDDQEEDKDNEDNLEDEDDKDEDLDLDEKEATKPPKKPRKYSDQYYKNLDIKSMQKNIFANYINQKEYVINYIQSIKFNSSPKPKIIKIARKVLCTPYMQKQLKNIVIASKDRLELFKNVHSKINEITNKLKKKLTNLCNSKDNYGGQPKKYSDEYYNRIDYQSLLDKLFANYQKEKMHVIYYIMAVDNNEHPQKAQIKAAKKVLCNQHMRKQLKNIVIGSKSYLALFKKIHARVMNITWKVNKKLHELCGGGATHMALNKTDKIVMNIYKRVMGGKSHQMEIKLKSAIKKEFCSNPNMIERKLHSSLQKIMGNRNAMNQMLSNKHIRTKRSLNMMDQKNILTKIKYTIKSVCKKYSYGQAGGTGNNEQYELIRKMFLIVIKAKSYPKMPNDIKMKNSIRGKFCRYKMELNKNELMHHMKEAHKAHQISDKKKIDTDTKFLIKYVSCLCKKKDKNCYSDLTSDANNKQQVKKKSMSAYLWEFYKKVIEAGTYDEIRCSAEIRSALQQKFCGNSSISRDLIAKEMKMVNSELRVKDEQKKKRNVKYAIKYTAYVCNIELEDKKDSTTPTISQNKHHHEKNDTQSNIAEENSKNETSMDQNSKYFTDTTRAQSGNETKNNKQEKTKKDPKNSENKENKKSKVAGKNQEKSKEKKLSIKKEKEIKKTEKQQEKKQRKEQEEKKQEEKQQKEQEENQDEKQLKKKEKESEETFKMDDELHMQELENEKIIKKKLRLSRERKTKNIHFMNSLFKQKTLLCKSCDSKIFNVNAVFDEEFRNEYSLLSNDVSIKKRNSVCQKIRTAMLTERKQLKDCHVHGLYPGSVIAQVTISVISQSKHEQRMLNAAKVKQIIYEGMDYQKVNMKSVEVHLTTKKGDDLNADFKIETSTKKVSSKISGLTSMEVVILIVGIVLILSVPMIILAVKKGNSDSNKINFI